MLFQAAPILLGQEVDALTPMLDERGCEGTIANQETAIYAAPTADRRDWTTLPPARYALDYPYRHTHLAV